MSYSFYTKCNGCVKKDKCVDRFMIQEAINCIHILGTDKGHLGGGSIELNCQNIEEQKESA